MQGKFNRMVFATAGVLLMLAAPTAANPFIAEGKTPEEVLAIVADKCMDNGDNVTEMSSTIVVCEGQNKQSFGADFFGSLIFGANSQHMKLIMRTVALPHPAGSRVRIQITMEADRGRGSVDRYDWTRDWKKIMPNTVKRAGLVPQDEWEAAHQADESLEETAPTLESVAMEPSND